MYTRVILRDYIIGHDIRIPKTKQSVSHGQQPSVLRVFLLNFTQVGWKSKDYFFEWVFRKDYCFTRMSQEVSKWLGSGS